MVDSGDDMSRGDGVSGIYGDTLGDGVIGIDGDTLGEKERSRDEVPHAGSKVRSLVDAGAEVTLLSLVEEDAGITLGDCMGEDEVA